MPRDSWFRGRPARGGRTYPARQRQTRGTFRVVSPERQLAKTSSGALTPVEQFIPASRKGHEWQPEAYTYNEIIGEVGYLHNLTAELVARCDLRVMTMEPGDLEAVSVETLDPRVVRVMRAFVGPVGGTKELLRRSALHYQIAGESILLGTPLRDEYDFERGFKWEFLSTEEIKFERKRQGKEEITITMRNSSGSSEGPDDGFVAVDAYNARFYRPSPRFSGQADSPMRRVLTSCRELAILSEVVAAAARSRLAAGILLVPEEISFGADDETMEPGSGLENLSAGDIDRFIEALIEHMSAPVEDRTSTASLVPLVVTGPAEYIDKIKVVGLGQTLDEIYQQLRDELLRRIAQGLDAPPEIMSGKSQLNHWCMSDDTKALTRSGWKSQEELVIGDEILTLNHTSGLSEWAPIEDIYRAEVIDEPMVEIDAPGHSSLSTLDHRWPTLHRQSKPHQDEWARHWTTSEKLNGNDRLITGVPAGDLPAEAKWTDAFVELAAWYWTEGTCHMRAGRRVPVVNITQSESVNPHNVARIRRALTTLYGPAHEGPMPSTRRGLWSDVPLWREDRPRPGIVRFHLNRAAAAPLVEVGPDRVISLDFIQDLTASQLALFVDASVAADGTTLRAGTRQIAQRKAERLDALELAAILLGIPTTRYPTTSQANGLMHMLSLRQSPSFRVDYKNRRTTYTGTVWCPTTANGTWFAKRDGKVFYTGNSAHSVDQEFVTNHVAPIGEALADFLTRAYLRPMLLKFEGMTEEEAERYHLVFDHRSLSQRSDEGIAASGAWDRLTLSDMAYLRANGFAEEDYPDDDERRRRFLEKLIQADPTRFGVVLIPILYPELADAMSRLTPARGEADPVVPDSPEEPERPGADEDQGDGGVPVGPPVRQRNPLSDDSPNGLVEELRRAAEEALRAALEESGERLQERVRTRSPEMHRRLMSVKARERLNNVRHRELQTLSITVNDLIGSAVTDFARDAQEMVHGHLLRSGVLDPQALEASVFAVQKLARLLDEVVRGQVGHDGKALPLPASLIYQTISDALVSCDAAA